MDRYVSFLQPYCMAILLSTWHCQGPAPKEEPSLGKGGPPSKVPAAAKRASAAKPAAAKVTTVKSTAAKPAAAAKATAKAARGRREVSVEESDEEYEPATEEEPDDEEEEQWGYTCIACGTAGELLCCEVRGGCSVHIHHSWLQYPGCSNTMHMHCAGLEEVPEGEWWCPVHPEEEGSSSEESSSSSEAPARKPRGGRRR